MDWLTPSFATGLVAGLVIGLGVAAYFWFAAWLRRRALLREVASLKEHLHRQMEINARGTEAQKQELEALRQKNENLRITNATLKQKAGRAEIETLAAYERALRLMHGQAPGFAPVWEQALREAEAELAATDSGLVPLIRKALKPVFDRISGDAAPPSIAKPEEQRQLTDKPRPPEGGGTSG